MTNKGGIVVSELSRPNTTRRRFDATSTDAESSIGGASGGPCRFCGADLRHTFVDLGMSPLCESYVDARRVNAMEAFYPLRVYVCERCFLVQLQEYVTPEDIFTEYAYFSSYSDSWLAHCRDYVDMITERLQLSADSLAVELASNDGYLLQWFVEKGIPVLGIEPALNVAQVAEEKGVPTLTEFFGAELASKLVGEGTMADLIIGNNVLAQVPDLNSFVAGITTLLRPEGVVTIEFPHLQQLVEQNQFDTIYHEHFSYFSLVSAERIFAAHGLRIFDVDELWTHGGSLRIYACHAANERLGESAALAALRARELEAGYADIGTYAVFEERARETKWKLLEYLIDAKRAGKTVAGYGAPGKGNTLLNYCGIRTDFIDFTVDRNPYKQGRYLPGTHIPIHAPEKIAEVQPDVILILPWNFKDEIIEQLAYARSWGAEFVVPIPEVTIQ
jgi:C-methyltransferase C-terminal domain/Putative zinc binding domain/Methyltransferase domain